MGSAFPENGTVCRVDGLKSWEILEVCLQRKKAVINQQERRHGRATGDQADCALEGARLVR